MSRPIPGAARAAFDHHLAAADQDSAIALALGLLADGVSAEDVLLGLIAPAQITVGARWETGEWTVAREHAATHVSEHATAAVAAAASPRPQHPGEVVVACTDGEWHTLPARILTEVLRLRGFNARFLGGDVSADQLVSDLHRHAPDAVALSCILSIRLPFAHRLTQVSQAAGVPVLAGGPGFGPDGIWAHTLGADLYAPDACGAVEALSARWPPELDGASSVDDDSVETYAELVRRRPGLLRSLLDAARDAAGRECPGAADTLGHLLDSLAAGVFVDDPRVFGDYLYFTAAFLVARSVESDRLRLLTDTLATELADLPTALAHLVAGTRQLDG